MPTRPVSLLIVDNDDPATRMFDAAALARGYRVDCATSLAAVNTALSRGAFDVALVDLALGAESGFDVIRRIKEQMPDTEIVVLSASSSLASALHSYNSRPSPSSRSPWTSISCSPRSSERSNAGR